MPKRAYHHGNLREELIRAATRILQSDGVQGLSLRRAAREAGVSHAAPAHHFRDKRGLLAAVATSGFRLLLEKMREVPSDASPLKRLRTIGIGYVTFALTRPDMFRAMHHPTLVERDDLEELDEAAKATFHHLVQTVEDCQRAGIARQGDSQDLALMAWSAVHGVSVLAVEGELQGHGICTDPEVLAATITKQLFLGMRSDEMPIGDD